MSNRIPYLSHRKLLAQIQGKSKNSPLLPPVSDGNSNQSSLSNSTIVKTKTIIKSDSLPTGIPSDSALQREEQSTESEVIQLIQDLAQTHKQLASQLRQEGKFSEAIAHYRQAIQLHTASNSRSRVLSAELVERENQIEVQEAALVKYTETSAISPTFSSESHFLTPNDHSSKIVELYLKQAQGFYRQRKWRKAIEACKSALEIIPETAEAYKWWGNILEAQGKDTDALGYYAKALQIDPQLAPVYVNLGNLTARKQQWQEAIEYYRQAIEINAQLAVAYRNLGKVLLKIGKLQEAFELRYQALNLEPNKATAQEHFEVGNYLWQKGWANEAITCYRRAVRFAPEWIEAYEQLGDSLIRQGQWQEGSKYMQKARELRHQG